MYIHVSLFIFSKRHNNRCTLLFSSLAWVLRGRVYTIYKPPRWVTPLPHRLPHHCRIITYTGHHSLAPKWLCFWGVGGLHREKKDFKRGQYGGHSGRIRKGRLQPNKTTSKKAGPLPNVLPLRCTPAPSMQYKLFGKDRFLKWL
jgi:hypothetical protein